MCCSVPFVVDVTVTPTLVLVLESKHVRIPPSGIKVNNDSKDTLKSTETSELRSLLNFSLLIRSCHVLSETVTALSCNFDFLISLV